MSKNGYLEKKAQGKAGKKPMFMTGVVMHAGTTKSGLVFSKEVMRKAVEEAQGRVGEGTMLGTFESKGPRPRMEDISHQVTSIDLNGDMVYATIKTLDTPKGRSLEELLAGQFVELVPEGHVVKRAKDGTITAMKLTGVSITRSK